MEPVKVMPPMSKSVSHPSNGGTNKKSCTNENAEIGCDHVKSRYVVDASHDTANAGKDGCKTHDGVQSSNSLGKISGSDPLANKNT